MLSKNNHKLQLQKLESTRQHFTIKKFTVGVASILISSTFALCVVSQEKNVQADVVDLQTNEQQDKEKKRDRDFLSTDKVTLTSTPKTSVSTYNVSVDPSQATTKVDKKQETATQTPKTASQGPTSLEQTAEMQESTSQADEESASRSTLQETPAKEESANRSTLQETPAKEESASRSTLQETPAKEVDASHSTLQETPTKEESASRSTLQETPAKEESASRPTLQETPAKEESASRSTLQETPAKEESASRPTLQETPTQKASDSHLDHQRVSNNEVKGLTVSPENKSNAQQRSASTNLVTPMLTEVEASQSETSAQVTSSKPTVQASPVVNEQNDQQWSADPQKAMANRDGLYTPQLSYNKGWYTMAFDPGMLTTDVLKGNTMPFTVSNHRSLGDVTISPAYKLRVQLDSRLADKVKGISVSVAGDEKKVVDFTPVLTDDLRPTNMWEANVIYSQKGIFGGWYDSSGKSLIAKNGEITLVDTVQNVLSQIPDVSKHPLVYNAYVYDDTSHTALLSTNNSGYIVGPGDPLVKVPVSSDDSKFNGAHSVVTYDPTIGKNGALVVFYQATKNKMWAYDNKWRLQFNYAIDPVLLPYLEKVNNAWSVELDKVMGRGAYGFEQDESSGRSVWKPLAYNSPLTKKVTDLPFNNDGTGIFDPTNLDEYIDFQNGTLVHGRPVLLRLVYRLNKKPSDIYADLLRKKDVTGNLRFSEYYSQQDGTMQAYSLATSIVSFNDSDGDGLPDIKEGTLGTSPYVSMPNVSNVYATEQKVHGQLVFSNIEKNPQKLTVTDKTGNVLGTTTLRPVKSNDLAYTQAYTVDLNDKVGDAGTELKVSVAPVLDTSDHIDDNTVPQFTMVTLKAAPVGVSDKEYPLNASFLEEPKTLVANADQLPPEAKYSWVTKPDLNRSGQQEATVKVSFADKYDPTYHHELLVPVLVKVANVDLKTGTFKVNPVTMHVNENSNSVLLTPRSLASWTSKDHKKTLTGDALWSLVKSVSWGESPVTDVAGLTNGYVTVATKDNKSMLANIEVNVLGAKAKADLTVPWGKQLEASDVVANTAELNRFGPVTYTWKKPLQLKLQPTDDHQVYDEVVVTYGDHTTQLLPVTVQVAPSEAELFVKDHQVKFQPVVVGLKASVAPTKALEGVTPVALHNLKVVAATFEKQVDTTHVGEEKVPAKLTFADSSAVLVNMAVKVVSQAQNYAPTVKDNLHVDLGDKLTPEMTLDPAVFLPTGTNVTWKKPVDTNKADDQTGEVEVTYPDGSKDTLPVKVKVGTDAEAVTPRIKEQVQVALGKKLEPVTVLDPSVLLPTGTQVSWNKPVDTTKAGVQNEELAVTYPDGSKDILPVKVKVGTDAEAVTPKTKTNIRVAVGEKLAPEMVLDPSIALPTGTKVMWKTPVDTSEADDPMDKSDVAYGELEVMYPDGSKAILPVRVKVGTDAEGITPKVKGKVQVALGEKLAPATVLDPSVLLPTGTKVSWQTPVDTTKAGEQSGELSVTYPDGSKATLPVKVKVGTDAEAVTPKVKGKVQVGLGEKLAPTTVMDPSVLLPTGTKVSWQTPVDTTKAGVQAGELSVTYPDGSKATLPVKVKVGTDAEAVTPKVKDQVQVGLGKKLAPTTVLDPSVELPSGTQVSWNKPVDTTKAGVQAGELSVTYPDGSKATLPVKVKVGTDAEAVMPKVKAKVQVGLGEKLAPVTVLDPSVLLPAGTKVSWQIPADTTKAGVQAGELSVTYLDGSKATLPVKVKVGTDAEALTPKVKDQVQVELGEKLAPVTVLDPSVLLPAGTKVSWQTPADTTKAGVQAGELSVTYLDGSKATLPVKVKVGTDAEAVTPKVKGKVQVALGEKLLPTAVLDSNLELPTGTKVSWQTPVDTTKAGVQAGELSVTYPDGSKATLPVKVKVGTDAEAVMPKVRGEVQVGLGEKLLPTAVLDPNLELPSGTQVSWQTPVDTTKAGEQSGDLSVTYPDGSKATLPVKVKVGTDAEAVTPKVKGKVQVGLGEKLAPTTVLDPSVELPTGTQVSWQTPVDTTKAGVQAGELSVTYPDGSKATLPVKVKVGTDAEAVTPKVKGKVQVGLGEKLLPTAVLDPNLELPTGTKVSWQTPVDTTKAGVQAGELSVTYPDGSKATLPVKVKVGTDAEAVTLKVKGKVQVGLGKKLAPTTVLDPSVELPTGTQVSWQTPVDTTKAGVQAGELSVTYPDGSKATLPVKVKVGTDAEAVTPKVKGEVQVGLGKKLAPTTVLDPSVELPSGTQVSWNKPVDTTKAGVQAGELSVTYPDGSKATLPVKVKVGTDAETVMPKVKGKVQVGLGEKLAPTTVLDPSVELPTGTQVSWQTPVDTTKAGVQAGELSVTYPDGSKATLPVKVKVGTDAEAVTPKVKGKVQVGLGEKLAPTTVLDPSVELPTGTQVSWQTPVDTTKAGVQAGELSVMYPDGSKDELTVTVNVQHKSQEFSKHDASLTENNLSEKKQKSLNNVKNASKDNGVEKKVQTGFSQPKKSLASKKMMTDLSLGKKAPTELPQTGEEKSTKLQVFGAISVLLGLFGFVGNVKNKPKKF